MNFQRSSIKIFTSQAGGSIIGFGAIVIFARQLQVAELGSFFLFQMLVSLLAVPASFGRGNAVIKKISEGTQTGNILATSIVFLVLANGILVVGIILSRQYINQYIGVTVAFLVAVGIVLRSLYTLPMNVLKGELRVDEAATLNLLQKFAWTAVSLILIQYGFGVFALIYGLLASYLVTMIGGVYKVSIQVGKPSLDAAKSLFNYWKYTIFSFIDSQIYSWTDIAVIGLFLTQSEVGIYEVAWRVTTAVILLSTAIERIILPQISSWDASESTEKIQNLFPNAILASSFLVIPAFFGVLVLSSEILGIIFGNEYAAGGGILVVLVFSKLVESIDRIVKNFLEGLDFPDLRMQAVVVSIVLNVILNLLLVWNFGMIGAAIATTIAFSSSTVITVYYLSNIMDMKLMHREIGWCILSGTGMLLILLYSRTLLSVDSMLNLLLMILIGVISYFAFVLLYSPIRLKIRYNINKALEQ